MVNMLSVYNTTLLKFISMACSSALQAACDKILNDAVSNNRGGERAPNSEMNEFLPVILLFGWSVSLEASQPHF